MSNQNTKASKWKKQLDKYHPQIDKLYSIYHEHLTDFDCESGECKWDEVIGVLISILASQKSRHDGSY